MTTQFQYFSVLMFTAMLVSRLGAAPAGAEKGIAVVPNEAARRVDVLVDDQPFTSYIWAENLKVPTLYPIRTASGTVITRGFPLEPRTGERVDHPHHVGMWLNYGSVNGVDFWNASSFLTPAQQAKMGSVAHQRIVKATGGADKGELEVELDWIMPDGEKIVHETASFVFTAGPGRRVVDRTSILTAMDKPVVFKDDKEGMYGLRVRRELEQPANDSVVYVGEDGKAGTVKSVNKDNVTGQYRTSEGKTGDAAWGTRGRWTMLSGKVKDEEITIAMLDHPKNVGFPTYWHARGYGLFAANPLGQEAFSNGKEKLNFTLAPRQATTFRYRVVIFDGRTTPEQVEDQYRQFTGDAK
ncbi:MAG TPA: PmoA family protein [Tepidisphaeraceae bacterium]|nr:PmoA family protein [Tepidisphaeraceae bacterium]